nr:zinc finger, CCHC-type, retrotransposon Gag domain protein [Tanacetum cinerariifolium]
MNLHDMLYLNYPCFTCPAVSLITYIPGYNGLLYEHGRYNYGIRARFRTVGSKDLTCEDWMVNTRTDADLLVAVQNALQTLLPQIRAEIREEFCTSSGPSDSGGNPPPITIHTWLEHFNKQKPRSFEKAIAPVDAENWISHIEKIFDVMGCEDAFKTRLAVYKFEGNALAWWKAYKLGKGGDERLKREYHSIPQTDTETSTEFMQRFLRLAGFLGAAAGTEEEQAKNFQWGLRMSTLNHLMCIQFTDVAQVPNAARNYEILHERDDDDAERPDKRRRVVIGINRPLNRVVTGTTVIIMTIIDQTGERELNMRQRRWLELLKDYDTNIKYHSGKANVVADALSRKSGMIAGIKVEEEIISDLEQLDIKLYVHGQHGYWASQRTEFCLDKDDVLWQGTRLCVPNDASLREALLIEAHSSLFSVKIEHQWASGLLQPLDIPVWKWDEISMDFVIGLPRTQRRHDAIWVVVDRLTKSLHFLYIRKDYSVSKLAKTFQQEIVRLHGTPSAITDGQTERTIQTLEDMLRYCALEWMGNWDDYICLVEFAYNNSWHASIKCAPFEMLYGSLVGLVAGLVLGSVESLVTDLVLGSIAGLAASSVFGCGGPGGCLRGGFKISLKEWSGFLWDPVILFRGALHCFRSMTGNKERLDDFQAFQGGKLTFRGGEEHKDETYPILKDFINLVENQLNKKREYSNPRTLQQNGVAERKNKALIEAAKTMLAESKLPIMFWTEAVRTACYVLNKVSVTSPHNKTPYALLTGNIPSASHFKPFGCHVTILNTSDHLSKFDGKADEGYIFGYSTSSKAYRVYNVPNKMVEKSMNLRFLEEKPNVQGTQGNITNSAGTQAADSDSDCDEQVIIVPSYPPHSIQRSKPKDTSGDKVDDSPFQSDDGIFQKELARLIRPFLHIKKETVNVNNIYRESAFPRIKTSVQSLNPKIAYPGHFSNEVEICKTELKLGTSFEDGNKK